MALRSHFKMAHFMAAQCQKRHWVKAHLASEVHPQTEVFDLTCEKCGERFRARESALSDRLRKVKPLMRQKKPSTRF